MTARLFSSAARRWFVGLALLAFGVWFFVFAGSSLPGSG
jgi:hypothetical protein